MKKQSVNLSDDLVTRIDAWAASCEVPVGRTAAIIALIERGLMAPRRGHTTSYVAVHLDDPVLVFTPEFLSNRDSAGDDAETVIENVLDTVLHRGVGVVPGPAGPADVVVGRSDASEPAFQIGNVIYDSASAAGEVIRRLREGT